jgi:hypothetical protein
MERPRKCMHPNCERCVFKDCIYDRVERKDVFEQDMFDKELEVVEPEVQLRRERQRRYNKSDKGKASRKRYSMTEKGIENEKRKRQRKIDNGRNAEYCRRYYYKKKMEMQGA